MEAARPATSADLPAVEVLAASAGREVTAQRGGSMLAGPPGSANCWTDRLGQRATPVWVGTCDGQVVGFAAAHVDHRPAGTIGVVEAIYVEPGARAVGVGEALMNEVLAWAKDAGCTGVDVPVLPGAREAKNFLEMAGFSARLLLMHRRLEG